MQSKKRLKRNQAGFTLIEVAIAALIAGMAATISLYYDAQQILYNKVHGQVDQLRTLSSALGKYEVTYAAQLTSSSAITGVNNAFAPTVPELQALGLLDTNFSAKNYYSGGYGTKLRLFPTGCSGTNCSIFGISYTTTPVVDARSVLDNASTGEATAYGGGDVAVSTTIAPGVLSGQLGSWTEPNPLSNKAGIIAYRAVYNNAVSTTSTTTSFSGPINMNNNAITGVDYVSGTVGQDLQIKTANGKDMYLENINDTPSSNLYANFKNSTFSQDVTVMGTVYSRSGNGGGFAFVGGDYSGNLNVAAQNNTGSSNVNDIFVRSAGTSGKWVSQIAQGSFTGVTNTVIGKVASQSLGTHRFCVLSGTESSMGTTPVTKTYQTVTGTVNGSWSYSSTGAIADYAQVSCFD